MMPNYQDLGSGQTAIVILASPLVLARTYRPVATRLARTYRVLTIELPGSGRSPRLHNPWSHADHASWLASVLERLSVSGAVVLGHSNSGPVATCFAAAYPERVRALVLVDSIGARPGCSLAGVVAYRALDGLLEPKLSMFAAHHALFNIFAHARSFLAQVKLAAHSDLTESFSQVTRPVLLAWGSRDHTMPPACAERLKQLRSASRMYVSPRGSHDWLITNPEEFCAVLTSFVESAPPADPFTPA
jgi:pimeloyl-ACP methyl ester carboxylesterase